MNRYPSWWDDTVTLYNKYIEPGTSRVTWYRHVISGCFYKHTVEKLTVGKTVLNTDATVCRFRVSENYLDRNAWLASDAKADKFTFGPGDIVVAGETDFEIDEYTSGHRSSDLVKANREYPGCFTIDTINIDVGGGRGNEHYHVRGV